MAEKAVVGTFTSGFLEAMRRYLRIEVVGLENVPRRGRAIIAPNHSGCAGYDAVMLAHVVAKDVRRIARVLTVWHIFETLPWLGNAARKLGLVAASIENGLETLRRNNLLLIFPEGEKGSFKPSSQAYQLQEFRTGFVRMAVMTGAPIVPCVVIGAEETHINLGTMHLGSRGQILWPMPLNVLPLPAKWTVRFLPPIEVRDDYGPEDAWDKERMHELCGKVRRVMQAALDEELARRPFVYFAAQSRA